MDPTFWTALTTLLYAVVAAIGVYLAASVFIFVVIVALFAWIFKDFRDKF